MCKYPHITESNIFRKVSAIDKDIKSSVMKQKDKFQKGRYKETKHAKLSEKRTFLTLDSHT